MWWTVLAIGWFVFLFWATVALPNAIWLSRRRLRRMATDGDTHEPAPTVTVVVPARDEGAKIEQCLHSLLASDYPALDVIAVDDRSADRTGDIMDAIAENDDRLRVIHVNELPTDWLGKSHAMHRAAAQSQSEYLLFTDGDVLFQPDAISLALRFARDNHVDHLCLVPGLSGGGYCENALVAFFGMIFTIGTHVMLIPRSFQFAYAGVGAFNLVRRSVYQELGGHTSIRLDVLDDVKLGKLFKRNGRRQDILLGDAAVSVRWQDSALGVVRGLEKNAFASMNYSVLRMLWVTCVFAVIFVLPYVGTFALTDARCGGFLAAALLAHFVYALSGGLSGGSWRVAPLLLPAALATLYAFWRSTVLTLARGGVRWRDTFYPLERLRRNVF
ncbi:MAG: glycosyl transferase family 2 [Planctomycetaceae bacterium]|nr:glycosyl transferase family 2 [Planctomycetaceae bacterium]